VVNIDDVAKSSSPRVVLIEEEGDHLVLCGKRLDRITAEEAAQMDLLCTSTGLSLAHCACWGLEHRRDFEERVVAYRLLSDDPIFAAHREKFGSAPSVGAAFYARR